MAAKEFPCHWTHPHGSHTWVPLLHDPEVPGLVHLDLGCALPCPGTPATVEDLQRRAHRARVARLRDGKAAGVLRVSTATADSLGIGGPVFVWAVPLALICGLEVRVDPNLPAAALRVEAWS